MPQLFLDCDGVLADFDTGARTLLRMSAGDYQARHGAGRFWQQLARAKDFYTGLPLMPDAMELFEAVRHLDPIILTGLPIGKWAEPQKRAWATVHFPGVQVITTLARHKHTYCEPGDLLVDDNNKYQETWESAEGIFIHHTSAADTLAELRKEGILDH